MKLTITNDVTARQTGASDENKPARIIRMKAFWADPSNKTLYDVGKILAYPVDAKRIIADVLASGGQIEMADLVINGTRLPLPKNFVLSLATLSVWGCVACRSAHGSGVKPSKRISTDLLASNRFFYNPKTLALFTISTSCLDTYTQGLGAMLHGRFVTVPRSAALSAPKVAKVPAIAAPAEVPTVEV